MSEGLNEVIFHLLWTKDKVFQSNVTAKIPDTLIYQYYQLRFWYFTGIDNVIKRKSKEKLTEDQIIKEFLKKPSASGIIAVVYFIENSKRTVEYLTKPEFLVFLTRKKNSSDMILQKFIDPSSPTNVSFSVLWTKHFCLFEKKQNKLLLYTSNHEITDKHRLYSKNFDIYEKAVTFEGTDYHVITSPIRGTEIPNKLLRISESIVSHISAVTFEKMKTLRMQLQFRMGEKNELWLLYATALRFENHNLGDIELDTKMQIPKGYSTRNLTVSTREPAVFERNCLCAMCLEKFESTRVVQVPYELALAKGDYKTIYNLHEKVTEEDLKILSKDQNFLKKKMWMCSSCFVVFTEATVQKKPLPLIGTGPLKPKRIKMLSKCEAASTKYSSKGHYSSRSSVLMVSVLTPSILTHSSSQHRIRVSTKPHAAGGELFR